MSRDAGRAIVAAHRAAPTLGCFSDWLFGLPVLVLLARGQKRRDCWLRRTVGALARMAMRSAKTMSTPFVNR